MLIAVGRFENEREKKKVRVSVYDALIEEASPNRGIRDKG
jgi:hypothetical protein